MKPKCPFSFLVIIGSIFWYVLKCFFLGKEGFTHYKGTYVSGYFPRSCGVSSIGS